MTSTRFINTILYTLVVSLSGCSLWYAPDVDSDRTYDPIVELLVVNNLAETLTSIELDGSGRFIASQDDAVPLGAVPNDLVVSGAEIVVTLSGENRLLILDESSFTTLQTVDFGPGVNPMETVVPRLSIFATTGLFTGRLYLHDREGLPARDAAGDTISLSTTPPTPAAPQGVLAVAAPAGGPEEVRILVANTAYSSARPSSYPYAAATLAAFRLDIPAGVGNAAGVPQVVLNQSESYSLEDAAELAAIGSDPPTASGLNPQQIIDLPGTDEILIIAAGVNYGGGGAGNDDGAVLVLDRTLLLDAPTLPISATDIVKQRINIGGSPGAGIVMDRDDGGYTLITAGTSAIRTVQRPAGAGGSEPWQEPASTTSAIAYTATGGLSFLSDIVAWNDSVYVADFGNDRVLRFSFDGTGGIILREGRTVSDGPIALVVTTE